MIRRRLAIIVLALVGCGPAPEPSRSPDAAAGPGIPIACLSLDVEECELLASDVLTALGPDDAARVAHLSVGPPRCEAEPCPRSVEGGIPLRARATWSDGKATDELQLDTTARPFVVAPRWQLLGPLPARSPRARPGPQAFELGHCGLDSGIDFDGSWWLPVGQVDAWASEAINAAPGTIALTAPDAATFATGTGFRVDLVRWRMPLWLPGCD